MLKNKKSGCKMKVAIVHDYLTQRAGGERAILALAKEFKADIWTTEYDKEKTFPEFKEFNVYSSPLIFYPFPVLTQMEAVSKFRKISLREYDIVISFGNWAKQVSIKTENHPHVHYEQSFYNIYENIKLHLSFPARQVANIWSSFMARFDYEAIRRIDCILCNSECTKTRLKKDWNVNARVIYPPVNLKKFKYRKSEDFFVSIQEIDPEKGIEIQLETFRKMPQERLFIIGSATKKYLQYFKKLKRAAPPNVTFLGDLSDEKIADIISRCKAVIRTGIDRDFSPVPVFAMASGKPCIATNTGSNRECIIHGKTGLLINPPYARNFINAVRTFDKRDFNPRVCRKRAEIFSENRFIKQMKEVLSNLAKR
jgi:glycosyltransferase involved in cell wall biosynthesis